MRKATGGAITPRVPSRELRELAASALIARKQYPVIPPKVEYRLSREGRAGRCAARYLPRG